ncbi:hypothetical protein [Cylindrospermum sp. FACHB-282]|uniref:hypothetical protein n=1 Tax=Cylindrospermum sp. FACHB-282 TaxID=2692794 RepID=UPI001682C099|nr:hypothetical protein [Cylindrospermum sp. FACHB-282]MBD2388271.1 hypothetical protein [Cylindrospermum sp. FACHB-282]
MSLSRSRIFNFPNTEALESDLYNFPSKRSHREQLLFRADVQFCVSSVDYFTGAVTQPKLLR